MALLYDRLGLPLLSLGNRQNVSANSLVPSPDYAVVYRNWDSLGLRLYEDAANELEKQKQALLVWFELPAEASTDSLGDRMRNALLGIDRGLAKISEAEISMAGGVICEGFRPRAYYQPLDGYIRWAGPNTSSTIYLPLDANNDRIIRVGIAIVMSEATRDGLALFINGSEIPLKRSFEMWKDGQYHLVCNAVIPKEKISAASQYTALEFRVPGVVATAPANVDFTGPAVSFALSDIRID